MTAARANLVFLPAVVRSSCHRALEQMRSPDHSRLLSGSMIMLAGTTLVSALNFAYNLVTAHLLGPADFGHASVAVTLLMLASAITLSFQLVCAKFVAREATPAGKLRVAQPALSRQVRQLERELGVEPPLRLLELTNADLYKLYQEDVSRHSADGARHLLLYPLGS